jgi:hypothetical protein
VLHQLGDVFAKERERRIGNDKVSVVEKFLTFYRAEVSVAFQFRQHILLVLDEPLHIRKINTSVLVEENQNMGAIDISGEE